MTDQIIAKFFVFIIKCYLELNKLSTVWRVLFSSSNVARKLLASDAIVLVLNTVLFSFAAKIFRGLIEEVLTIVIFLNILAFVVIKIGWSKKLLNKK
jgi:hypothetical protein